MRLPPLLPGDAVFWHAGESTLPSYSTPTLPDPTRPDPTSHVYLFCVSCTLTPAPPPPPLFPLKIPSTVTPTRWCLTKAAGQKAFLSGEGQGTAAVQEEIHWPLRNSAAYTYPPCPFARRTRRTLRRNERRSLKAFTPRGSHPWQTVAGRGKGGLWRGLRGKS